MAGMTSTTPEIVGAEMDAPPSKISRRTSDLDAPSAARGATRAQAKGEAKPLVSSKSSKSKGGSACRSVDRRLQKRRGRKGKSIYRGVCVTREGKWRAVIYKDRKQLYLGVFDSEVVAAKAHDKAARYHFGDNAVINFPEPHERDRCSLNLPTSGMLVIKAPEPQSSLEVDTDSDRSAPASPTTTSPSQSETDESSEDEMSPVDHGNDEESLHKSFAFPSGPSSFAALGSGDPTEAGPLFLPGLCDELSEMNSSLLTDGYDGSSFFGSSSSFGAYGGANGCGGFGTFTGAFGGGFTSGFGGFGADFVGEMCV